MLKTLTLTGLLASALIGTQFAHAQALPTATASGKLEAGFGVSYASPDYGQKDIQGISGWVDFDFSPRLGLEAAIHYVALVTPTDLAENSYGIGPRYHRTYGRITPYAKVVVGIGSLVIQEQEDNPGTYSGSYLMYGFGGGVDVRASSHITIRPIDFEFQKWPGLGHGLSPYVATAGVAWRFR